jgi:hypothetical protein
VRGLVPLGVIGASLAAAAGATAATPPHPQVLVRSDKSPGYFTLAGNARGDRIVVRARDLSPEPAGIDVFSAPPGSPFGAPSQDHRPGVPDVTAFAAVGPDGTAAVVGIPSGLPPSDGHQVMALVRAPGGTFDGPVAISGEGADEDDPYVTFDAQGNAVAVWARAVGGEASDIEQSTRPSGGTWSAPQRIAHERRGARTPLVAFDASGGEVAVWTRDGVSYADATAAGKRDIPNRVVAAIRPPGGDFGPARVVSRADRDSDEASLSVNAHGRASIVWVSNTPGDKHFRVGSAFRAPGHMRFGKPRFLTPPHHDGFGARAAMDSRGRTLITWLVNGDAQPGMSGFQVRAAVRSRSGHITRPRTISGRRADFNQLAMNAAGQAVVSWVYHRRHHDEVQARWLDTRRRVGPLRRVSARGGGFDDLVSTIDDAGSATLVWTHYGEPNDKVETVTLPR